MVDQWVRGLAVQAWDPEFSPVSMGGWSQVWLRVDLGPWHCVGRDKKIAGACQLPA